MSGDPTDHSPETHLQLVAVLSRTIRTGALYGENHASRRALVEQLLGAFGAVSNGEPVVLRSAAGGLELGGTTLSTEDAADLGRRLAAGGLAFLELGPAITEEELSGLVSLIAVDFESMRLDADLATMLWERDWPNVRWEAVEVPSQPKEEEPSHFNSTLPENRMPEPLSPAEWTQRDFTHNDQESAVLSSEVAALATAPTPIQVGGILCQLFGLESERDHFSTALELLRSVVDQCIRDGQFSGARETIQLLDHFRAEPQGLTEEKMRAIVECQESFASSEAVGAITHALASGTWDSADAAVTLIAELRRSATPHLFDAFLSMPDGDGRAIVHAGLADQLRRSPEAVTDRLSQLEGDPLIAAIRLLKEVKTKEVVAPLGEILRTAPTAARVEVVEALESIGGAHARSVLARLLSDPSTDVRCRAAWALPRLGVREALEPLLKEMLRSNFRDRDIDERRVFFQALGSTNVPEVLPFLRKLLTQKGWLRRKQADDDRLCAAGALALMTHPEAEVLKAELMSSGPRAVQDYLAEATHQRGMS